MNNSKALQESNGVVCEDGVLIFQDWNTYYKTDRNLSTYTLEEKKAWEDALSFRSQKLIFDNIAAKEYDIFITPYENKPESFFLENPEPDHCAEYYDAIKDGIIKDIYDDGHYMAYSVSDISKVAFINKKGFIKIDSILYQYKGNLVKFMINGNIQDCELLNSTNKTNKKLGIFVNKILEGSKEGDDPPNLEDPFYKKAYTHPKDWTKDESKKFRVNCTTSVEILGHGAPNMFEYTFQLDCKPLVIILESQRKNGWGNWINYHGEYNVSGLAGVIIEEGTGGIGQPPTNTQPYYPDFMLNFQTIHGNTGSTFFPKTLNQNMVYYNGIVWTSVISKVFYCPANINPIHYDITADIAGGVHGIHVHNIFQ